MAKKIELLNDQQEVVHPLTSPDCIIMENGKTLDEVMGDGIATPTLTHEGTSFKVGVGDSNIEVVDGDVAGMTLKGQSYQNILPKPTTLIMETDEKEFKINDKIDSNIIIDDNIAEIATVKGKTIVNAVQEESASEYTVLGEDLSGQSIVSIKDVTLQGQTLVNLAQKRDSDFNVNIEANKNTWSEYCRLSQTLVKEKKYFIAVTVSENTMTTGRQSLYINNGNNQDNQYAVLVMNQKKGYLTSVFTANFDTSKSVYVARESHTTDGTLTIKNDLILCEYQEGMENWDIPFFEGEKYFESNIKGVTLQGQTLVNTIQEPCKDDYVVLGADDSIEISAETGGCGTIEDTIQGGINGAILKGQTLVNLHKLENYSNIGVVLDGGINQHFGNNTSYATWRMYDISMLKPNTEYGVFCWVLENTLSETYWDGHTYHSTDTVFNPSTELRFSTGETGLKFAKLTTISDFTGKTCGIRHLININTPSSEYIKFRCVIVEYQEGMENWDIPYFEGMKSVQMPVLKTTGKNLFDYKSYGGYNKDIVEIENGLRVSTWSASLSFTHNLLPNTTYTSKSVVRVVEEHVGATDTGTGKILIHNGTTFLPLFKPNGGEYTFTTPSDIKNYDRILFYAHGGGGSKVGVVDITNMQLEEGSTATSYEPYKLTTVTTSKIQLTEAMLEQGSVDEKKPVGTLYINMKNTSESAEYYKTRIRTATTYKVKPNTDYQLKLNSNYRSFIVCFNDGKYMSHITWNTQGTRTFTVPSNCNEIALVFCLVNGASISASEFLNMGVELAEALTLRAIGDVKDELDLQTGKLTQRIGEVVLDGSEDWKILESYTNEYRINFVLNRGEVPSNCKFICNQYVTTTLKQEDTLTDYMYVGNLNINVFTKPNTTLDEFKLQLQSNPLILQYPLATPIVKTIDLQVTDQDNNTIPHIQTQPTVTHITASSDYLIPTVTIDNNLAYDTIIKPSTLYTIRFKHDTVNADNPLTVDLGGTTQTVTSTEFTITTPNTLAHNQLVFSGKNNVVSEVQVIEGDVTNIEYPFFEGMSDVKFSDGKFIARNCPFIFGKGGRI